VQSKLTFTWPVDTTAHFSSYWMLLSRLIELKFCVAPDTKIANIFVTFFPANHVGPNMLLKKLNLA